MRRQLQHELRLRVVTDDAVGLPAVLEQDHGRYGADTEATGCDRVGVDVELGDADLLALLVRDIFKDGSDHLARTAPRRPEIDEHGHVRLQDLLLEGLVADDLWLSHQCGSFTSLPPKRELLA